MKLTKASAGRLRIGISESSMTNLYGLYWSPGSRKILFSTIAFRSFSDIREKRLLNMSDIRLVLRLEAVIKLTRGFWGSWVFKGGPTRAAELESDEGPIWISDLWSAYLSKFFTTSFRSGFLLSSFFNNESWKLAWWRTPSTNLSLKWGAVNFYMPYLKSSRTSDSTSNLFSYLDLLRPGSFRPGYD